MEAGLRASWRAARRRTGFSRSGSEQRWSASAAAAVAAVAAAATAPDGKAAGGIWSGRQGSVLRLDHSEQEPYASATWIVASGPDGDATEAVVWPVRKDNCLHR
eukprot:7691711-Alexandrium_andersonii.AAC.1